MVRVVGLGKAVLWAGCVVLVLLVVWCQCWNGVMWVGCGELVLFVVLWHDLWLEDTDLVVEEGEHSWLEWETML
jgi:hypothetical protein